jgi:iron complex outermembrane receptor protein
MKVLPVAAGDPVRAGREAVAVAAAIFALAMLASPVLAQSQRSSSSSAALEEIIVTAQKREQDPQDVGLSITAFSADDIQNLGFFNAQDLVRQTPGLSFNLNANDDVSMTYSLRGVGLDDFSAFNEAPVAIYFDGVYQATLAGNNSQLFDLERVEVLKGPQGTLYGRNTTGGIVHFISRKPTDELEGYIDATVGEYALHRFEGAVSGPLNSWLNARLSGVFSENDGYSEARLPGVDDSGSGNEYAARLQFQAEPNDHSDILFSAYYIDAEFIPTPYEHGSVTVNTDCVNVVFLPPDQPNPLCPGTPGADCLGYQDRDGDPFAQDNDREKLSDLQKFGAALTINWGFDGFTLTSITGYQDVDKLYQEDADAGPVDGIKVDDFASSEQWSQELRLAGGTNPLRWTGGFYYFDRVVDSGPRVDLTGVGFITGRAFAHDDTESWALFGQAEYDFAPSWTGILGLRYTQDKREFELQAVDESGLAVLFGFPPNPIIDFRRATVGDLAVHDDDSVSGRAELDWRPSDDWLVYGSWSRGIKSAGFNQDPGLNGPRDPTTIPVGEEVLTAYELGAKSTLADGKVRLNSAVFYYDYDDFQAFTFQNLLNKLSNQDAEIYGFEAELLAHPWERWNFRLGVELLNTTVEGLTVQSRLTGESVALGDREMALAPDVQVNGVARYEWPFWNGHLGLQGDFTYMGEHFLDIDNNPTSIESDYLIGNARLSYQTEDNRYLVTLWVQNVGDTEYRTFNGPITGNGYTLQQFGKPRWYGASLRVNF